MAHAAVETRTGAGERVVGEGDIATCKAGDAATAVDERVAGNVEEAVSVDIETAVVELAGGGTTTTTTPAQVPKAGTKPALQ